MRFRKIQKNDYIVQKQTLRAGLYRKKSEVVFKVLRVTKWQLHLKVLKASGPTPIKVDKKYWAFKRELKASGIKCYKGD